MRKKIIYITGMPGSGKLTMAKMIAQQIDAKIIDNHKVNNLLFDIKQFNEEVPKFVWTHLRNIKKELYFLLANLPQDNDYIFTGITTIYKENMSYEGVRTLANDLNAEFCVINLVCTEEKLLSRIDTESRRENKKITSEKLYKELIDINCLKVMEDGRHCVIDNTNLTEAETLEKIMEFLNN